ncbi:hypothetical protein ACVBEQ_08035 [Nakamurella sp. GG22]
MVRCAGAVLRAAIGVLLVGVALTSCGGNAALNGEQSTPTSSSERSSRTTGPAAPPTQSSAEGTPAPSLTETSTDARLTFAETPVVSMAGSCEPYSSTLGGLADASDSIVLGVVVAERPFIEGTYGPAAFSNQRAELPPRRGDFLNRLLQVDIEQTLSGEPLQTVEVIVEGWISDTPEDVWVPIAFDGNHRLAPGDRAVLPLRQSMEGDPVSTPDSYSIACTGPFVIVDGLVAPKPDSTNFREEGAYSMSEKQLIEALRSAG